MGRKEMCAEIKALRQALLCLPCEQELSSKAQEHARMSECYFALVSMLCILFTRSAVCRATCGSSWSPDLMSAGGMVSQKSPT